jgi:hypothetical protein
MRQRHSIRSGQLHGFWRTARGLFGAAVISLLCACGGATPTAAPAPASATAAAVSTVTPTRTIWIANTGGAGAFVRNSPRVEDRLRAFPDGTPLLVIGDDADGDGLHWYCVQAPDGTRGYVPSIDTVATEPIAAPPQPTPGPASSSAATPTVVAPPAPHR